MTSLNRPRLKTALRASAASVLVLGLFISHVAQAQTQTPSQSEPAATGDDTVIVTGVRNSIRKSLAIKRRSTQVVDSIVAEDIGKLPDNNVVDALQRVAGVQVTGRSGGEATAISIRGMPDITTTWNGRNVFTASGRQFALQDIPANLVRELDVYKTRAADQIETGIAGQVDVKTLRPFDFKGPEISVAARNIYLDPAKTYNPNVSAMLSNRWSTSHGDIGALLNVSYSRTKYSDQSVTAGAMVPFATTTNTPPGFTPLQRIFTDGKVPWVPGQYHGLPYATGSTMTFGTAQYPYYLARDAVFQNELKGDRERPAVNVALQWQPNADAVYTFEYFYDGYRNTTFNNLFFTFVDWWGSFNNPTYAASTFTLYPGTNIMKTRIVNDVYGFNSGDTTVAKTDSNVFALNGKWNIGAKLKLVGDLSYQDSTFASQFLAMRTDRVASQVHVDFNNGEGITNFGFSNTADLTNPSKWNVAQFYDNANRNTGSATTLSLDGTYAADWGPINNLSFGVRYDDRKASEANSTQSSFLGVPLSTLNSGLQYYNNNFFDGRADVPTSWVVANGYYIKDNISSIRALYHGVDPAFSATAKALFKTFDIEEKTATLYVQADAENTLFGRRLRSEVGLRYVNVKTDMTFYQQTPPTQKSASKSVGKVLPSVTLRYDVLEDVLLRFNYGETLRRPNFTDLNPNLALAGDVTNVGIGGGTGGNPDLEATHSKNYDFTAEWYFAPDSAVYGTLFRREIQGLVVPFFYSVNVPDADPALNTKNFRIAAPVNASDGVLTGMELGFTWFPKNLPGVLDGFGIQASATTLDSTQNVPVEGTDAQHITKSIDTSFFGVSELSYNTTIAYDKGPVGARLSYVYRKNFLDHNEASIFANPLGVWKRPEKSLDFQLNYNVNSRLSLSVDATNLTNELSQTYYYFGGSGGQDLDNFGSSIIGRSIAVGLRWKM
jgi:iron complex outermembrane recepter protein